MKQPKIIHRGKVIDVSLCGTVIVVSVAAANGDVVGVYFDHRMFQHLLTPEGCVPELIGRAAEFDGEFLTLTD